MRTEIIRADHYLFSVVLCAICNEDIIDLAVC